MIMNEGASQGSEVYGHIRGVGVENRVHTSGQPNVED